MDVITNLTHQLEARRNPDTASQMRDYMKGLFPFLGVKAPERQKILKAVVAAHKEHVALNVRNITQTLYGKPEREYHYCAIELIDKFLKNHYQEEDLDLILEMIHTHSHWDSVDFIAKHLLGNYLLQFWEQRHPIIEKLTTSDKMWYNRSAILFQLGYKSKTDESMLFEQCQRHKGSNEFFIQKAIGWALREYGKTNPEAVIQFVNTTDLKPLSRREALKRLV